MFKGSLLHHVKVYGRITERVSRPSNISSSVGLYDNGMFVGMDVFAVRLDDYENYLRQNGYTSYNNIYMVNGSIVTYIAKNSGKKLPDWYQVSGTLSLGKKTNDNIMAILSWQKSGKEWSVMHSLLEDLDTDEFDKDSIIKTYFDKSLEVNDIVHPDYVESLTRFNSKNIVFNSELKENKKVYTKPPLEAYASTTNEYSFKKESRETIKQFSPKYNVYKSSLGESDISRNDFIEQLKGTYNKVSEYTSYIEYTVKAIADNLRSKPSESAMTGKAIIKLYLSKYGRLAKTHYLGVTCADFLADNFAEVKDFILYNYDVNCSGDCWELCKLAFYNPELFYAGIVSILTNTSFDDLQDIVHICDKNNISFSKIVNENPYLLQVIGNLSYNTIDYIALCFGKVNDKSLDSYRNISILHSYISDTNNGSTVFRISDLYKKKIGNKMTANRYELCLSTGTYLSRNAKANIESYFGIRDHSYDVSSFVRFGNYYYIKNISRNELNKAIEDYKNSGLGVIIDDSLTSCYMLEKELYVYNFLYSLGKKKLGYNHDEIDKYIDLYEEEVGFKLEPEQRQAVHLIDNCGAVVAGSAGSGKTTVSNCFVFVLKKLEYDPTIKFSAPTGKAAKRMQEVVKQEVKTLNSMFKVFNTQSNIFDSDDEFDESDEDVIYMFDEGAMITLDLLYSVLKKFEKTNRLYLFGDFNQLSPIGKGLPFKDLLRFMPCVFLNVSKRASEGSNITKNSDIVNNYSNATNWKDMESGNDFILLPCSTDNIPNYVRDLCAYYLNKLPFDKLKEKYNINSLPTIDNLSQDDIQVVTPLTKATYPWGATRLNTMLQPLFNSTRSHRDTFVYQTVSSNYSKFVKGDRVIHTDSNMYSMQWYESYKDGVFKKKYGFGICNGEVGKLVGFFKTDECYFEDEEEGSMPDGFQYPEALRDDTKYDGKGTYFVVVEYYDYLSMSNFYILYRGKTTNFDSNIGLSLNGEDLSKLMLFYAGTTHKLQGSQAKLVISVLGNVDYKGFITRNMIYTMFTRAEKLELVVGSVGDDYNSMLSKARRDIASTDTLTVGEMLSK